jgi:hypothetical protein
MSEDDAVAAYLARERAALGRDSLFDYLVECWRADHRTGPWHCAAIGEDADMFSGSGAPASGGMDSFPDLGEPGIRLNS